MRIDFSNMFADRLADKLSQERVEGVKNKFLQEKDNLGFVHLPNDWEELQRDLAQAEAVGKEFDTVVVIGTGGSLLGARAAHHALNHEYYNQLAQGRKGKKIYFVGDTTDPRVLAELLDVIELASTLFIVISKSGNTIEQASNFVFFQDKVKSSLGKDAFTKHFIFITDPDSGDLQELAKTQGYAMIAHPKVGGRFSVLSCVGMVPVSYTGLNIEQFLKGARDLESELESASWEEDIALKYASLQYGYFGSGKNINVLMPYHRALREFGFWYRQLWAESLGKRENNKGELVNVGATPMASIGPADQHSQLQLYNEGPNDKTITFIIADKSKHDLALPQDYQGVEQYEFFKGRAYHEILRQEMDTTIYALTKNERPNCTIEIDILDEYNLGQLFYFFEMVVAYMGYFFDINVYNQPGVEMSKNAMYGLLGQDNFAQHREEFQKFQSGSF